MIDSARVREILGKLSPAAEKEGIELEFSGLGEDEVVEVRARRVATGAPVAFLIKAVEGTFRRYYPEVPGIRLIEYDPGPKTLRSQKARPIEDTGFASLARHKAPALPPPKGIPAIDLHGLDRKQAIRVLENFVDLWGPRDVDRVKVIGLTEDAPGRAIKKWLMVYPDWVQSKHLDNGDPDVLVIHLKQACSNDACSAGDEVERMPGKILMMYEPEEPESPDDEDDCPVSGLNCPEL